MARKPFDLFISHSSKNKEIAERLYWLAVTNQLSVWYDSRYLEAGLQLRAQLEKGIAQSANYLLFLTPEALSSEFVRFEMGVAKARVERHGDLKVIVVKLSAEVELDEWWNQFVFEDWSQNPSEAAQLVPFLSRFLGTDPVGWITEASFLSQTPSTVFTNESRTVIEHARNATLYYLSAMKAVMQNAGATAQERAETLDQLAQLSLLQELPAISGASIPIRPGEFEYIHSVRMRIPPRVGLMGLPEDYVFESKGNHISTRVRILDARTRQLVTHPVPLAFSMTLDAELG